MYKVVKNVIKNKNSIVFLNKETINKIIGIREQRAEGIDLSYLSKRHKQPRDIINDWCSSNFEKCGGPTTIKK